MTHRYVSLPIIALAAVFLAACFNPASLRQAPRTPPTEVITGEAPAAAIPTPSPQVITVVVVVTATEPAPTATPQPSPTPRAPTATVAPTTRAPTATPRVTATATRTPVPALVITIVVTATGGGPTPAVPSTTPLPVPSPNSGTPYFNNISAVYGPFQHGFMIYVSDRRAIWVFIHSTAGSSTTTPGPTPTPVRSGTWMSFPDTFRPTIEPDTDPAIVPPPGLLQPKGGFGKVWRDNPPVRAALGWATDWERSYTAAITDFPVGTVDFLGIFTVQWYWHTISTVDGAVIRIDEPAHTWTRQ